MFDTGWDLEAGFEFVKNISFYVIKNENVS